MSGYIYEKYWKEQDRHWHEYGALRAKNLAEEIVAGWIDQTDLFGFDRELTEHALTHYADLLRSSAVEMDCNEVMREVAARHCDDIVGEAHDREKLMLGWSETMIASRALKAFREYLQNRLAEMPPEQAEAA